MIEINTERCNGCGQCVEVCPNGAVYLVAGRATVEPTLCHDCQACIAICPMEAISLVTPKEVVVEPVHVPATPPEMEAIQVRTKSALVPFRTSLLSIVGGALAWGWREVVPRLADYLLYDLDHRAARRRTLAVRQSGRDNGSSVRGAGRGRRQRRRQRGP